VRNEKADEFLALLKEWTVLCDKYVHGDVGSDLAEPMVEEDGGSMSDLHEDEFIVEKLICICYGGNGRDNRLYLKVLFCCFFSQACPRKALQCIKFLRTEVHLLLERGLCFFNYNQKMSFFLSHCSL
jgi:hypothetical protein